MNGERRPHTALCAHCERPPFPLRDDTKKGGYCQCREPEFYAVPVMERPRVLIIALRREMTPYQLKRLKRVVRDALKTKGSIFSQSGNSLQLAIDVCTEEGWPFRVDVHPQHPGGALTRTEVPA